MLTLLTTSLIFGSLLQDAAPTAAPAVQQDPKALAVLEEFDAQLYSPSKAGLETLAFDMEMPGPGGQSAGTLSVNWSAKDGATGTFEMAPAMKAMIPEAMLGQINDQMGAVSEQIALIQINGVVRNILEETKVTLAGVDEGYVKVVCDPIVEGEGSARTLYFEDGLLAKTVQMVMGQMGEMESIGVMEWESLGEDSELLVLAGTTETTAGMAQTSRFVREKIGKFYLVTKIEGEAMGQASTIAFKNFVVNGKAAAAGRAMAEEKPSEG